MTRYWKKKLWEEYGVIVKKIRHIYNPFTSWGFSSKNYIVYYWIGCNAGSLLANYDIIFHEPEEIIKFLEEQKKNPTY
mgnify:CR=1 FL=1